MIFGRFMLLLNSILFGVNVAAICLGGGAINYLAAVGCGLAVVVLLRDLDQIQMRNDE